jgi:hypothetical protein
MKAVLNTVQRKKKKNPKNPPVKSSLSLLCFQLAYSVCRMAAMAAIYSSFLVPWIFVCVFLKP